MSMRSAGSLFLFMMAGAAFWAAAGLFCGPAAAADPDVLTVRTAEAKLFAQPVKIAPVLETLKSGTELLVLHRKGEWVAVSLPDQRLGWVHQGSFTAETAAPPAAADGLGTASSGAPGRTATLKAASGRVRKAPSLEAPLAFGLSRGSRFTVTDRQGDWYHIRSAGGQTGWIYHTLVAFPPPPPAESEAPGAGAEAPSSPEIAAAEPAAPEPGGEAAEAEAASADAVTEQGAAGEDDTLSVILKARSGRVRNGPSKDSPTAFGILRGTRAMVTETEGDWYRIQLPDGRSGWASRTMFEIEETRKAAGDAEAGKPEPPSAAAEGPKILKPKTGDKPAASPAPAEATAAASPEAPPAGEIRAIRFETTPEGHETIRFELNGFHPPKTYTLDDKAVPVVVCEFEDIRLSPGIGGSVPANGVLVKGISIRQPGGKGSPVLVEASLDPRFKYSVDQVFFKKSNLYVMTFKK